MDSDAVLVGVARLDIAVEVFLEQRSLDVRGQCQNGVVDGMISKGTKAWVRLAAREAVLEYVVVIDETLVLHKQRRRLVPADQGSF